MKELPIVGLSESGAFFSPSRLFRYTLWRRWEDCDLKRLVAFCGLNPSTADESINDPTVTRCINFAKDWGYGGMVMLNAFAFRATDPKDMKKAVDPVGPGNDSALSLVAQNVDLVVCCWGTHAVFRDRHRTVIKLLQESTQRLCCLKKTQDGHPGHPLYLKGDSPLMVYP